MERNSNQNTALSFIIFVEHSLTYLQVNPFFGTTQLDQLAQTKNWQPFPTHYTGIEFRTGILFLTLNWQGT